MSKEDYIGKHRKKEEPRDPKQDNKDPKFSGILKK